MRKLAFLLCLTAQAQDFTQRGYIETGLTLFPQTATNDSGHAVEETLFRYDASFKVASWLKLSGSFDARFDSHRQDERSLRLDFEDRGLRRPSFALRRLSATLHKGKLTAEIGRQFIRWGKADILNPTDRFAPKDFLSVVDSDFLAVPAVRATYESGANTVDLVWQVRFTPSRTPLLNQRWTVLPEEASGVAVYDAGARYPGGSQFGTRFNHVGKGYEYSLCFFDGRQNLPAFDVVLNPIPAPTLTVQRYYPELRLYGGDIAVPLKWFTVKAEGAYFTSETTGAEEYVLYVIQLERQVGEWSFVGGYAGSATTREPQTALQFAPDRGFARSFLGRAGYTIDANRSVAFTTAVRQNGAGSWLRGEYSQTFGQHWRATAGLTWIRGDPQDFLGQYRRNSYASIALRYSF